LWKTGNAEWGEQPEKPELKRACLAATVSFLYVAWSESRDTGANAGERRGKSHENRVKPAFRQPWNAAE
jgi:hypothetical protein